MIKIETGVMVMKNGKAWGTEFDDGKCHSDGWVEPEYGGIHDERFCTNPTDVTWKDSPYVKELKTAKLVKVERRTETTVLYL